MLSKPNAQRQREWTERQGGKPKVIDGESLATIRQTQAIINASVPKELREKMQISERKVMQLLIHIGSFAFKPGFAMVELDELLKGINELVLAQEGAGIPTAEEINDCINSKTVMGMTPWPSREDA